MNNFQDADKHAEDAGSATGLHVDIIGTGPDMVLLHGWGLNSACWQSIIPTLSQHFRLHLVDLPGFGFSHAHYRQTASLTAISTALAAVTPPQAIWLGWSLGGLCATHFALTYPHRVSALVTVASSPKFVAQDIAVEDEPWCGISSTVLAQFQLQLQQDLTQTINRFLSIQALGSVTAKQDIKRLKILLSVRPEPHEQALTNGLALLANVDLRSNLTQLVMPVYRFYGRLDSLVPQATVDWIDARLPDSPSVIFQSSSHAPFISEPDNFINKLQAFLDK